jgi:hypothetical protein
MPQLRQQFQKPLTVSSSLHADPRARRELPVEFFPGRAKKLVANSGENHFP